MINNLIESLTEGLDYWVSRQVGGGPIEYAMDIKLRSDGTDNIRRRLMFLRTKSGNWDLMLSSCVSSNRGPVMEGEWKEASLDSQSLEIRLDVVENWLGKFSHGLDVRRKLLRDRLEKCVGILNSERREEDNS